MNEKNTTVEAERRPILDGALVADIHSCAYAEDGRTLIIVVDLEDGRTASISICPGAPVTAAIVG